MAVRPRDFPSAAMQPNWLIGRAAFFARRFSPARRPSLAAGPVRLPFGRLSVRERRRCVVPAGRQRVAGRKLENARAVLRMIEKGRDGNFAGGVQTVVL